MHLKIEEEWVKGDMLYDGDLHFLKNCEVLGTIKAKSLKGKALKVHGIVYIDGDIELEGDLEAYEIITRNLIAKNIFASFVSVGKIVSKGSIVIKQGK